MRGTLKNIVNDETLNEVNIRAIGELSTRIDPDEIIKDKKIGEGSFGVVYSGMFRSNKVAVKVMKMTEYNDRIIDEFNLNVHTTTFHSLGYEYIKELFNLRKCVIIDRNILNDIFLDYFKELYRDKNKIEEISGFLVGGASLDINKIIKIKEVVEK